MIITLSQNKLDTQYSLSHTMFLETLSKDIVSMNPDDECSKALAKKLDEVVLHINAIEESNDNLEEQIEEVERQELTSDTELEFNLFENLVEKVNVYGRSLKEAVEDELAKHQLVLHT